MRLRRGSPACTLGPVHTSGVASGSGYQSSPLSLGVSARSLPVPPSGVNHHGFRTPERSHSSASDWDLSELDSDACSATPMSHGTRFDSDTVGTANTLSFYTFNALLGYSRSHSDVMSPRASSVSS